MQDTIRRIDDIPYAPEHGFRGLGDLFMPAAPDGAPAALVIHGGGWNAMDKRSLAPVARLVAGSGFGAFSVSYRLIGDAPWPACGDDCVRAARFLREAGHKAMTPLDRSRLLVIGASAGGHLALWTGLSLPASEVRGIVSIAGPSDLVLRARQGNRSPAFWTAFFGGEPTEARLHAASPVSLVVPGAPPLLCVHSTHDELVRIDQSHRILEAYGKVGARAELATFPGRGKNHGIWEEGSGAEDSSLRVLVPEVQDAVRSFLATIVHRSRRP